MIYQLFHQHKATNELVLAGQSGNIDNTEQMKEWERAVSKEMPLPNGYQWLMCNEESKYFDHEAILVPAKDNENEYASSQ